MAGIDHLGFIVASYAAAAAVVAALVVWVVVDYRTQRRSLADLETRGIVRRSSPPPAPAPERAKEPA